MAYVKKIFDENFLYYASYVIKDRAIPDIEDGLKPVQRRILHSLFEMDDGKFHKVANVVGHCMKYHPHGDQSIGSALVVLANKDLFIDKQGNFGNFLTGDDASAARYIECRITPLAGDVFYNPKITQFVDSYDGRNKEPVFFPAKLPTILMIGADGIAVGMSTRILPHNPLEVIDAEIKALRDKRFKLYPDFPGGGFVDVSEYADGMGKVKVRAKLDVSDPKKIVIRELPFGSTTESIISSIENAAKSGKIKIASISDFTTEKVEIEIRLQRGSYAEEVIDSLYAFTECENSISCNFLVIENGQPVLKTVTEVVKYHAKNLVDILQRELKIEEGEVLAEMHARTLERIFIEERVYKVIEKQKTPEDITKAIVAGLLPFKKEIGNQVTIEDIDRLLKIPIRRISLYDIERAQAELKKLEVRLKEIRKHLATIVDYAVAYLEGISKRLGPAWKRKTELKGFELTDVKEAARKDLPLRYDAQNGYLGLNVNGEIKLTLSSYDKILFIRKSGIWSVVNTPEKLFVDQGLLYCALADKERLQNIIFTMVYKDANNSPYIKRFRIDAWIMNKDYPVLPEGAQILWFSTRNEAEFTVHYEKKPRQKIDSEIFELSEIETRGSKAGGIRLSDHAVTIVEGPADEKFDTAVQETKSNVIMPLKLEQEELPLITKEKKPKEPVAKAKPAKKAASTKDSGSKKSGGLLARAQDSKSKTKPKKK